MTEGHGREFSKSTERYSFFERFTVGNPDCPIMKRLTIVRIPWLGSVRIHRFMPNADDRDVHDHPWNFLTFVLFGHYEDRRICDACEGTGRSYDEVDLYACPGCGGRGIVLRELMTVGKVRYRSATHQHITHVGPRGCLTVVLTGPVIRDWGFMRAGDWIWWKTYGALHGFSMNCENVDADASYLKNQEER